VGDFHFYFTDDIEYFAPIELHTKYGRTGHIKGGSPRDSKSDAILARDVDVLLDFIEPLGTHGYFKAIFDQPIQQMDTVWYVLL
jgi:pre-rRNA-processing protein TSR1